MTELDLTQLLKVAHIIPQGDPARMNWKADIKGNIELLLMVADLEMTEQF